MEGKIYENARKVSFIIDSCETNEQLEVAGHCVEQFRDTTGAQVNRLYDRIKYRPWKVGKRKSYKQIANMSCMLLEGLMEQFQAKHTLLNPPVAVHHAPTPVRIKGFCG